MDKSLNHYFKEDQMRNAAISQKLKHFVFVLIGIFAILLTIQCSEPKGASISVWSSSLDGDRLSKKADAVFIQKAESSAPVISIDEGTKFQKIDGFGATFNEAGMICLNSLPDSSKEKVLQQLFDPQKGAGYTAMKSPIAACDFASAGRGILMTIPLAILQ
jgi:O-glycosyl hydrolase